MTPIFTRPQRPRRDVRKPIAFFAVLGVASLLFAIGSATVLAHRYREMMRYMQDTRCARPNDSSSSLPPCQNPEQTMTVVGTSWYVETHHYRSGDVSKTLYAVQLRDAGGRVVTERGISETVGQAATVGRTVTAEFWHGRLTGVQADGHSSTTSNAPFDAAMRAVVPTVGGFFVAMACGTLVGALRKGGRRGF